MSKYTALFLPSHSVINAHRAQYKIPPGVVQAICIADCVKKDLNILMVVPKGTKLKDISKWDSERMIAIEVDFVRDQLTGAGTYSEDIHKYLTTRRSPIPYDIVISWNAQMTVGMQRMLRDGGYGGTAIPVITYFEVIVCMAEWKRNPAGDHLWAESMEILEAFCSYFGPCVFSSPYNTELFKRQLRKIMSPAYQRIGLKNVYKQWRPENCPSERYLHKWKRGKSFYLIIAGGFGSEREGIPKQAEVAIEAIEKVRAMGEDVRLIVCSTSSETEWTKKVLREVHSFVDYYFMPKFVDYQQLWKKAHCGISLRELDDGPRIVFAEFMMAGKPTIWLRTRYSEGWINDAQKSMSYSIEKMQVSELVHVILRIMDTYESAAKDAYEWGEVVCKRHSSETVRSNLMSLVVKSIIKAEESFNYKNFKVFEKVFEKLNNKKIMPVEFDILYKKLNEVCGKSFGMYSKLWVAKMLRRYSHKQIKIMPKVGKLGVYNVKKGE